MRMAGRSVTSRCEGGAVKVKRKKKKRGRCQNCGAVMSAWKIQICPVCIRRFHKQLWGK